MAKKNRDGLVIYPQEFKDHLKDVLRRSAPFLQDLYGVELKTPGIVYSPYPSDVFKAFYCKKENVILVTPTMLEYYLSKNGEDRACVDIITAHELSHGYILKVQGTGGGSYARTLKELSRPGVIDFAVLDWSELNDSRTNLYYNMNEALPDLSASFAITHMRGGRASDAEVLLHLLSVEDRRLKDLDRRVAEASSKEPDYWIADKVDTALHALRSYPDAGIRVVEIFLNSTGSSIKEIIRSTLHNVHGRVYLPGSPREDDREAYGLCERQFAAIPLLRKAMAEYDRKPKRYAPRVEKIAYALEEIRRLKTASGEMRATLEGMAGAVA